MIPYCVGVENETSEHNKFYIDKEKLCFIKMISYSHSRYSEAVFAGYKMEKGKYIATKVLFYNKGQLVMTEDYFNINFPESLNQKIFEVDFLKRLSGSKRIMNIHNCD